MKLMKVIINETTQGMRRSSRTRNQRYNIHPDDIGENDDEKDKDYQNKNRT